MLLLPSQANLMKMRLEKLVTYLLLAEIGCPVFKSAIIFPTEQINQDTINQLRAYFHTGQVTVRYQYIRPCHSPIQGGNRYPLSLEALSLLQNEDTVLWLLEPINRLENEYGINLYFHSNECKIELVGRGFDVSDLNRGHISPHQTITTELPIRKGWYNEWWKFLRYSFVSQEEYQNSQAIRIQKLKKMGLNASYDIFCDCYRPLPYQMLEQLLYYIVLIHNTITEEDFCVSCSISNGSFVFWDIQTPNGKKIIYGVS